ncbi:hypothetical protein V5O48_014341 [Marasmius crinis-equi]|uniref:Uncharacterized protein n=1 Tax=Marasmius crinis-equi TaxID=585013 RepID=A0ABR3EXJ9_9AGAR
MSRLCVPNRNPAPPTFIPIKRPHPLSNRKPLLLYLANGQTYTQDPTVPTKLGQVGFQDPPVRDLPRIHQPKSAEEATEDEEQPPFVFPAVFEDAEVEVSAHASKRRKQS